MVIVENNIEDFAGEVRLLRQEVNELRGQIAMIKNALLAASGQPIVNPPLTTIAVPLTTITSPATVW